MWRLECYELMGPYEAEGIVREMGERDTDRGTDRPADRQGDGRVTGAAGPSVSGNERPTDHNNAKLKLASHAHQVLIG